MVEIRFRLCVLAARGQEQDPLAQGVWGREPGGLKGQTSVALPVSLFGWRAASRGESAAVLLGVLALPPSHGKVQECPGGPGAGKEQVNFPVSTLSNVTSFFLWLLERMSCYHL